MRIIGLDLAITSLHRAVVMEDNGRFVTPVLKLRTSAADLTALLARARQGTAANSPLTVVMEPTGLAWLPVAAFLQRQGVTMYLVNSQDVAALRRYYSRHAKSDRIDARLLAKLPLISPEKLHVLFLASAEGLALQRACREVDWLTRQITALQNQLTAIDRTIWLAGWEAIFTKDPFGPAARWTREHYYDPRRVLAAGTEAIRREWQASGLAPTDPGEWTLKLITGAEQVLAIYGESSAYLDFTACQNEVRRKQHWLRQFETELADLRRQQLRPLYRQLHPTGLLQTIKGVGEDGAAVFVGFIGDPQRFRSGRACRGWSGLVPRSSQSSDQQSKGLRLSLAGPSLVKKLAYLDADVARRYDPQLAKIYYDQMVHKGHHHTKAVCAVATHLLDRILVVLKEQRPYALCDVDGRLVSDDEARQICLERYTVPEEVRRRNNRRARKARTDHLAEYQFSRSEQHETGEGKRARSVRG